MYSLENIIPTNALFGLVLLITPTRLVLSTFYRWENQDLDKLNNNIIQILSSEIWTYTPKLMLSSGFHIPSYMGFISAFLRKVCTSSNFLALKNQIMLLGGEGRKDTNRRGMGEIEGKK